MPQDSFLFQVNLGGMIDILSNHLYSSPDVFVRELLQNAVDAIAAKRLRLPQNTDRNEITLTLTEENGAPLLCFADTGTGLTESEIHRFLAVIGLAAAAAAVASVGIRRAAEACAAGLSWLWTQLLAGLTWCYRMLPRPRRSSIHS